MVSQVMSAILVAAGNINVSLHVSSAIFVHTGIAKLRIRTFDRQPLTYRNHTHSADIVVRDS